MLQNQGVKAINWSPPDLYHLTLVFLGELSGEGTHTLSETARTVTAEMEQFDIRLGRVETFPRNRILFAGLAANDGLVALSSLQGILLHKLESVPFLGLDKRPYHPHITLARKLEMDTLSPEIREGQSVVKLAPLSHLHFTVDALSLFSSTRIDGRLRYPVIERFAFFPRNT